jgi:isoleucyl-tRNA synthetase
MAKIKNIFNPVDSRLDYNKMNEEVIKFWKENKVFEKSIEQRDIENSYVFYDGPPFVTGLPHYGSLLPSIAKDLIPRYQTMRGKRVRRVWGWDCHGLPIENKVENKLGLKNRRDIEKIGLQKFIEECRSYVSQTSSEWNWYIDHVGRWVDMENAYRTMDLSFMESVMWVFKTVYDKGLIYKGKRVSLYCPRCGTPVSNFEIAMDNSYRQITEPANTYKYKLEGEDKTYILAWSTTPWNKLATPALAVNPDLKYVKVKQGDEYYILAKSTLKMLKNEPYEIVEEFKGSQLEDKKFEPHYDFYEIPEDKRAWIIVTGDFVTAEEGTGVVTLAVYGEDDYKVMQAKNIALIEHVNEEGHLTINKNPWKDVYYLKANQMVNEDLKNRGLMYREDQYTHTVPVCWRCETRLMFAPQDAWYLRVSDLKEQLLQTNENIYWFPHHLKHGRFQKGIESAPDWCVSRTRYWATPMPIWECDKCDERKVIGSIAELEKLTNKKVTDLHRPYIDEFIYPCEKCNGTMKRVPDVLDAWMESGSMPYGERHYPFEKQKEFENNFPADFVCEYLAQTRAWFYVMHVLSNALFQSNAFKNVICTGVIRGTDGRKMSKSYGNYPDPRKVIETYGGDALRLYLMSSPVMSGENLNISEEDIKEQNQRVLSILWNSYNYFITYANLHGFDKTNLVFDSNDFLDRWIMLKLQDLTYKTQHYLDRYDIPKATRLIRDFVSDLSTWYIRRNRDRFAQGDEKALKTLYLVLRGFTLVAAPTIPFIAESMYQNLINGLDKQSESVHLCDWPKAKKLNKGEKEFIVQMDEIKEIARLGNAVRKDKQMPIRQPLTALIVKSPSEKPQNQSLDILKGELNVKEVLWQKADQLTVDYDFTLTKELEEEGEARKIIRKIQEARKKAGTNRDKFITITLPVWPKAYENEIKQKALVKEIKKGDTLTIL